jgi:hypothetical protein
MRKMNEHKGPAKPEAKRRRRRRRRRTLRIEHERHNDETLKYMTKVYDFLAYTCGGPEGTRTSTSTRDAHLSRITLRVFYITCP